MPCLFGFVFKIGHKHLKLPSTLHSLCRSARTSFFLWIIKLLNFWCSQNECHGCFRCYSTWAFRCWGCYRCRGQFVQTARSLWPLRPKLQSRTFNQGEVLGGIFQWLKDKEPIGRVCQDIDDGPTDGFLPLEWNLCKVVKTGSLSLERWSRYADRCQDSFQNNARLRPGPQFP